MSRRFAGRRWVLARCDHALETVRARLAGSRLAGAAARPGERVAVRHRGDGARPAGRRAAQPDRPPPVRGHPRAARSAAASPTATSTSSTCSAAPP
ncbi:hypothetical protein ACFSTC_31150 [Nonomuraea ferruginea]